MSFEYTPPPSSRSTISRAGNRLLGAARRNPEALVILAAGAAMLLRRGSIYGSEASAGSGRSRAAEGGEDRSGGEAERGTISEAAEAASEYVSDTAARASRSASRVGSRIQSSTERLLQGQPAAVAAFGLATGAVFAAILPRSNVEQRALRPAREALVEAASRATESVKEAAERRLSPEGLRDLAGEAAKVVTQTVLGTPGEGRDSLEDRI